MISLSFNKLVLAGKLDAEITAAIGHEPTGKLIGISTLPGPACVVHLTDDTTVGEQDTVTTLVNAHDPTPPATPVTAYTQAFYSQRKKIFSAFYTYSEGFRTASASPSITQYRTVLGDTLTIILTLPATWVDEIRREQAGQQLPNEPSTAWTLAQCQGWHTLLSGWLGRAMAGVAGSLTGGLD